MSNSVKFSIDGDTNAEQVAGRAKAAVSGLDKQLDGIGKKFGSSFKDIFLSFLGPMALISTAMAFIGKMIADHQKKQEDANNAAINNTNALMSAEDNYWANKRNNEKRAKADAEEAKTQRRTTTQEFMSTDPRGYKIYQDYIAGKIGTNREMPFERNRKFNAAGDAEVQAAVQALIAPEAAAAGAGLSGKAFKAPEGFGNVIGVGSNPVLDAMTSQLEEAKRTNDLLTTIANAGGGRTTSWLNTADAPAPAPKSPLNSK